MAELYGKPEKTNGNDYLYKVDGGYLFIYSNHHLTAFPANEPLVVDNFYYAISSGKYVDSVSDDLKILNKTSISDLNEAKPWATFTKESGGVFYMTQSEKEVAEAIQLYNIKLAPQDSHYEYDSYGGKIYPDGSIVFESEDHGIRIEFHKGKINRIGISVYASTKEGLLIGDTFEMVQQIYGKPLAISDGGLVLGYLYKEGDYYFQAASNNRLGLQPSPDCNVQRFIFVTRDDDLFESFYPQLMEADA